MDSLMPATATTLARIIRVRQPSGPLALVGYSDGAQGAPIPDLDAAATFFSPAAATGNSGIDADLVVKVAFGRRGIQCGRAKPLYRDQTTQRPVFGIVTVCGLQAPALGPDLEAMMQKFMHLLAMAPDNYATFQGYVDPYTDVIMAAVGASGRPRSLVHSPQVLETARRQFACPGMEGVPLEDGIGGSGGAMHWETALLAGELMSGLADEEVPKDSAQRPLLTDVTLALLQDSGWYDVKYGSAGFDTAGYRAGCEYAAGAAAEAAAAPAAQPYLCAAAQHGSRQCTPDHSAVGVCDSSSSGLSDGINLVLPQRSPAYPECRNNGTAAGRRCLTVKRSNVQQCVDMTCSAAGRILVDSLPCNNERQRCPDDGLMCADPGHLTCVDTLNDCSGHGNCLNAHCFCHLGWGGADCSVPICLSSCEDGLPCPASGFCGVPECGEWSVGPDDRGTPCNAAAYTPAPALNTSLAVSPADESTKSLGAWFFAGESPQSGAPLSAEALDDQAPASADAGPAGPDVSIAIPCGAEEPASIGLPLGTPAIGTPAAGRTAAATGSPGEEQEEQPGAADAAAEGGGAVHLRAPWAPLPWGIVTAVAAAVMLR